FRKIVGELGGVARHRLLRRDCIQCRLSFVEVSEPIGRELPLLAGGKWKKICVLPIRAKVANSLKTQRATRRNQRQLSSLDVSSQRRKRCRGRLAILPLIEAIHE